MVCKPIIKACLFLVTLTLSSIVTATGLGKFTLNSYFGQPLKAEIDLVSVEEKDVSSLQVGLASNNTFNLADVKYLPFLDTLEFSLQNRSNGQFYVRITSSQPIMESSFKILIQLNWSTGNLIREYSVFLEPSNEPLKSILPKTQDTSDISNVIKSKQTAAKQLDAVVENLIGKEGGLISEKAISKQRPSEKEQNKAEEVSDLEESVKSTEPEPEPEVEFDIITYGPVKEGDTLFKIVREETSYRVQLNQLLIALYRANPEAFANNNMNHLKTGFILRIPAESEVESISPDIADKEVKMHTTNWEAYRQKLATDVIFSIPQTEEEPAQTATGEITTIIDDISTETVDESSDGVLRLSKGADEWTTEGIETSSEADSAHIQEKFNIVEENAIASEKALNEASERIALLERAMEENRIANEKELNESNQRIIALEKNVKELQQLLKLKNSTMADIEAKAESTLSAELDSSPPIKEKPVKGIKAPTESVEGDRSNQTIIKWLLWAAIFLVAVGLWWKIKQLKIAKNSESTDTI